MKVFISYAREDWEIAERVWGDLKRAGIDAWIDRKELLPGQNWKTEISKAIRASSHFIALLSTRSVSKQGFFQTELKKAIDVLDTFPEHKIYFIPARIDDCESNCERLENIHRTDLFPSYEEGLNKVLRVLQQNSSTVEISERNNPATDETIQAIKIKKFFSIRKYLTLAVLLLLTIIIVKIIYSPKMIKPDFSLRRSPIIVFEEKAKSTLKLDKNWRPLEYVKNEFKDNGNDTITDHATRLIWQKSGSDKYLRYKNKYDMLWEKSDEHLTHENAMTYTEELNRRKFAGFNDWRLPTVDELKSLVTPEEMNMGLHIDPIFDKTQKGCWTSDQRGVDGAWFINFVRGSVEYSQFDSDRYVRAVRSIK